MAQLNYIPDPNDQYQGYKCLPAGEYKVQITDSDVVVPKSGKGKMLKITYEVIGDPQYDGCKIPDYIIIEHESVDAERIGKQKLNTICALTGVKSLKDSVQLHGKTLSLLLTVKEYQGDPQNNIKKYLPLNANTSQPVDSDSEQPRSFIKK